MYIDFRVKCLVFLSGFNRKQNVLPILVRISNMKLHENFAVGSRALLCGQTDRRLEGYEEYNTRSSQVRCGAAGRQTPFHYRFVNVLTRRRPITKCTLLHDRLTAFTSKIV
jgi:hypothetical protein